MFTVSYFVTRQQLNHYFLHIFSNKHPTILKNTAEKHYCRTFPDAKKAMLCSAAGGCRGGERLWRVDDVRLVQVIALQCHMQATSGKCRHLYRWKWSTLEVVSNFEKHHPVLLHLETRQEPKVTSFAEKFTTAKDIPLKYQ